MNYAISFQDRIKLGMERLSKQSPVTLSIAREQVETLKAKSNSKIKKKRG